MPLIIFYFARKSIILIIKKQAISKGQLKRPPNNLITYLIYLMRITNATESFP
jgi:hypothetical protein